MEKLSDATARVEDLKALVGAFAEARDWGQFHSPKNLAMAMAGEAAEVMEHFLWCDPGQSREQMRESAFRDEVAAELADTVIYALHFANQTGIDLAAAIEAKMQQNEARYPVDKARGNAEKYTAWQDQD